MAQPLSATATTDSPAAREHGVRRRGHIGLVGIMLVRMADSRTFPTRLVRMRRGQRLSVGPAYRILKVGSSHAALRHSASGEI